VNSALEYVSSFIRLLGREFKTSENMDEKKNSKNKPKKFVVTLYPTNSAVIDTRYRES